MDSGQELFYVKLRGEFLEFSNISTAARSDQVLCGSGHELILVDREARKKLPDVNKYWILATTRKNTIHFGLYVRQALVREGRFYLSLCHAH